ncbi:hypothetical protein XU18_2701 [Perkinsela sp. CCAP 1560/4]|nr:hypothetical protein XU18_2701 [Perkinsela sp. CCAP 1560/4]|eukprot:KNH06497.1 hypothetical protein XU18_2701 [Perkinsela sp. CCAP 1560/4]
MHVEMNFTRVCTDLCFIPLWPFYHEKLFSPRSFHYQFKLTNVSPDLSGPFKCWTGGVFLDESPNTHGAPRAICGGTVRFQRHARPILGYLRAERCGFVRNIRSSIELSFIFLSEAASI